MITWMSYNKYTSWASSGMVAVVEFLLDHICDDLAASSGRKIGIPVGIKCASLIADLFLYCFESVYGKNSKGLCQTGFGGQV